MKTIMKKIILIMGLIILSSMLTACGGKEVVKEVSTYLGDVKSGKFENNKMIQNIIENSTENISDKDKKHAEKELINLIFTSFDYNVGKAKIKDDTANVEVKLKTIDIIKVFTSVQAKTTQLQSDKKDVSSPEVKLQLFKNAYVELKSEKTEKQFNVELKKVEEKWVISNEKELLDQLSGGILSKIIGFDAVN